MSMRHIRVCEHCHNELSKEEASGDKCPYCRHPFIHSAESHEEPPPRPVFSAEGEED